MRVVISKEQLSLSERLAAESNRLSAKFSSKKYLRIENIDRELLKSSISVEKKKVMLLKRLHSLVIGAFSIRKNKFRRKQFESFKKKVHNIRRVVIKLRSINYYLATTFIRELGLPFNVQAGREKTERPIQLDNDELAMLEFTAYKLISEAVVLDNRLIEEYARKQRVAVLKEKSDIRDLRAILGKETALLEHLEAKLPPPSRITRALLKEPIFTHWVARVFALLGYLESMHAGEAREFALLKKNKAIKTKINRKIIDIVKEKYRLMSVMREKALSMKSYSRERELRQELHNFTTALTL